MLFLIYAHEIFEMVRMATIRLYADDSKLYLSYKKDSLDGDNLQDDLDRVSRWAETWQLRLSQPKCEVLYLGHGNPKKEYHMGTATLRKTDDIRDLGVQITSDLKYHKHIDLICARARRQIHFLFRAFITRNQRALLKGYCTFVRPILEYCSPVWSPSYLGDLDKIEKVQKYFTRWLHFRISPWIQKPSYSVRLHNYNLDTLERRRLLADLKLYFQINRNFSVLTFDTFFNRPNRENPRLGNRLAVRFPKFRTEIRKHHFSIRGITAWNSLPNEIVMSQNENIFRRKISSLDLANFLHSDRWEPRP